MDKDNEFFGELHELDDDFDDSSDDMNIDEIIYQCENAVDNLNDTINQYNYMVSEMSGIIDDEEFEQETVKNVINDYKEAVEFMGELKNDIAEGLDDLKKIIVESGETFAAVNFDDLKLEKNAYKYSLMLGYLSSLITEYDDVMEDVSADEEDFEELCEFVKNNGNIGLDFDDDEEYFDDEEEYSDDDDENRFYPNNDRKIINFDDFNDLPTTHNEENNTNNDIYNFFEDDEDFENSYSEEDDEIVQSIKDDIERYEGALKSVIQTLREENIEEEFICKITKRYRRLIDKLKAQLGNNNE